MQKDGERRERDRHRGKSSENPLHNCSRLLYQCLGPMKLHIHVFLTVKVVRQCLHVCLACQAALQHAAPNNLTLHHSHKGGIVGVVCECLARVRVVLHVVTCGDG